MPDNSSIISIDKDTVKLAQTQDLISTSFHEAAHTIYSLLHFMEVDNVSVFYNNDCNRFEGLTYYYSIYHEIDLNTIEDYQLFYYIIISEVCTRYSGQVGERLFFKTISGSDKLPIFVKNGSSNDTEIAAGLISKYNLAEAGKPRYNYKKKLIKNITKELQTNWGDVTLIAHLLFKKKKITYNKLKTLLIKNSQNKDFWKSQFKIIEYIYSNISSISHEYLKTLVTQ